MDSHTSEKNPTSTPSGSSTPRLAQERSTWSSYFGYTAIGSLLRAASGGKSFRFPEELPGYQLPTFKLLSEVRRAEREAAASPPSAKQDLEASSSEQLHLEKDATTNLGGPMATAAMRRSVASAVVRPEDDLFVVDWYGEHDAENPHNWTMSMKVLFLAVLAYLTFSAYMGAAIITPGVPYAIADFGISEVVGDLFIGLYVLGYAFGPMIFGPLSEIPSIGRLPLYVAPLVLFFAVGFAPTFSPSLGGVLVGRLLTGFLCSSVFSMGGASVGDVLSPLYLPIGLCVWVAAAYQGPGLGPVISGYVVQGKANWRYALVIYQGFVLLCVISTVLLMPETSGPNILARRAARIRKLTGDNRYRSAGEIQQATLTKSEIVREAIIRPLEITIKDPSVAFVNIYVALVYAFYYLYFAGFPTIFYDIYGFGPGNAQLPYLSIAIGGTLFALAYIAMFKYIVIPKILAGEITEPEQGLDPAIPAAFLAAASQFCVGWGAEARAHWMVPTFFTAVFAGTSFWILQPIFGYLAMSYPQYQASLFAANDLFRSLLAFALLCGGSPLFNHLGVGKGYSILGALLAACIVPLVFLRIKGKALRMRSKFAVKSL